MITNNLVASSRSCESLSYLGAQGRSKANVGIWIKLILSFAVCSDFFLNFGSISFYFIFIHLVPDSFKN